MLGIHLSFPLPPSFLSSYFSGQQFTESSPLGQGQADSSGVDNIVLLLKKVPV